MESKKKQDDLDLNGTMAYLMMYNFVQTAGWTSLLTAIVGHYLSDGNVGLYASGSFTLNIFQTLAVLEVVHAMLGLVKTNVVLTAFQVMSRLFLTWGIVYSVPQIQDNIGVTMFLMAWSVTETFRYSYYMCAQVKNIPHFLLWARYTFFIVLYPIGVTGELLAIYVALPYLKSSQLYSISMPNPANIGFSYYSLCICAMFMYIPVFPQLYGHMLTQRKKFLGGAKPKQE